MNKTRKLASLLLALVMVLGMVGGAMAEYTITAPDNGHTYEVYQIFTGDLSDGVLSNVKWGKNGTGTEGEVVADEILAALEALTAEGISVNEKLAEIKKHADLTADKKFGIATSAAPLTNVPAGYYLIKDVDDSQTGIDDVYTTYIVKIVNDVTIAPKGTKPEVEKDVVDPDVNIGDTITYTLTATMPSDLTGYATYKVIFHDTMSVGLDFIEVTSITVDGTEQKNAFTSNWDEASKKLTVSCDNVLALDATTNSKIIVTYTAKLNDKAVIGTAGNKNEVILEYSNNPSADGDGTTGKTPPKDEIVYTWEIPVFKYTGSNTALPGAGFTLYTDEACTNAVNLVATDNSTIYKVCTLNDETDTHKHVTEIVTGETGKFEIEGLEKGTYYLKETTTPAGYNTAPVTTVVIGENGALTQNGEATNEVGILNQQGSTLPETGGIGTTLFYIAGSILVVGALVLMITKRRVAEK